MKYKITKFKNFDLIEIYSTEFNVKLIDLGATIVDIKTKDKENNFETIIVTYDDYDNYVNNTAYLGSTIGPTSGRIANGRYFLENKLIELECNVGGHNLHGGSDGFHQKKFKYEIEVKAQEIIVTFSNNDIFEFIAKYTIKNLNIKIEYFSKSVVTTLCNITNHVHFNLSGNLKKNVLDHYLKIEADKYGELNEMMICSKVKKVFGSVFDFNEFKKISNGIEMLQNHPSLGWDHPWILKGGVFLFDEDSKRSLTISTNYDSVVIYSFNYPNEDIVYPNKKVSKYAGLAIECQHFPNGINMVGVNKSILKKGIIKGNYIEYSFSLID